MVKYADDLANCGLIQKGDESDCKAEIENLVSRGTNNKLSMDITKTKEMAVDFIRNKSNPEPVIISGQQVEIVTSYKYLDTVLTSDLSWAEHIMSTVTKGHQRVYFLRQHHHDALLPIYNIILVCFSGVTKKEKDSLEKLILTAWKVIGKIPPLLEQIYHDRALKHVKVILKDKFNPLNCLYH